MSGGWGRGAEWCEAAEAGKRERIGLLDERVGQSTPPRAWLAAGSLAKKRLSTAETRIREREKSATPVVAMRRRDTIRQEIIGRTIGLRGSRLVGSQVRRWWLQSLVHQPAREHGRGVLLKPLVKKFTNLLAEVRSVPQTGQFVGLQGIARGSEKKLPRWLNTVFGHGDAPKNKQVLNVTVLTKTY
jgi:hypothetical protein